MSRTIHTITALKPTVATGFSGIWGLAELAVWRDAIQGWAAAATVVIGFFTGIFILIYWALKAHQAWRDRNKRR